MPPSLAWQALVLCVAMAALFTAAAELWRDRNGCEASVETGNQDYEVDAPGAETSTERWAEGCSEGAEVQLWTMADVPHIPNLNAAYFRDVMAFFRSQVRTD